MTKIDAYIHMYPEEVQEVLEKLRQVIHSAAPGVVETISYGIPTFDMNGRHLVHIGAFKKHISFFPTPSPIAFFKKELAGFKTSKGTVRFPLGGPVPYDLIRKMVAFRVEEVSGQEGGKK